jgi:hypothetical protein
LQNLFFALCEKREFGELGAPFSRAMVSPLPSLFVAAYSYEYLSTLDSTDHDVIQDTKSIKWGLSWHGIYFAFMLSPFSDLST